MGEWQHLPSWDHSQSQWVWHLIDLNNLSWDEFAPETAFLRRFRQLWSHCYWQPGCSSKLIWLPFEETSVLCSPLHLLFFGKGTLIVKNVSALWVQVQRIPILMWTPLHWQQLCCYLQLRKWHSLVSCPFHLFGQVSETFWEMCCGCSSFCHWHFFCIFGWNAFECFFPVGHLQHTSLATRLLMLVAVWWWIMPSFLFLLLLAGSVRSCYHLAFLQPIQLLFTTIFIFINILLLHIVFQKKNCWSSFYPVCWAWPSWYAIMDKRWI